MSNSIVRKLGRWGEPEYLERDKAVERVTGLERGLKTGWGSYYAGLWFVTARAFESLTHEKVKLKDPERMLPAARRKAYVYYGKALAREAACKVNPSSRCEPLTEDDVRLARFRQLHLALALGKHDEAEGHLRELRKYLRWRKPSAELVALLDLAEVGVALGRGTPNAKRQLSAQQKDRALNLSASYLALLVSPTGKADTRHSTLERINALLQEECDSEVERAVSESIQEWAQPGYCEALAGGQGSRDPVVEDLPEGPCRKTVSCEEVKILFNASFVFEGRQLCFADDAAQCACGRQLGVYQTADECYRY